ncbi:DUF4158 domain-containing protein [Streptomyces sp. XH2]|uniref:DUF4158 domain-containing protein n=1 Tax=Streptomyces sp. XH2 TaxID=3412483 RepID=UPI003C79CB34
MRVQQIDRKDGRRSWTIVWPEGTVHKEADRFLREYEGSGTQRTYAYLLVDHLRWLERECFAFDAVVLRDLERYMGLVGAEVRLPLGEPWRLGKRPYGQAALSTAAACLKGFYLQLASLGVNADLGSALNISRLPTRADRDRALLGHVTRSLPANPLAVPWKVVEYLAAQLGIEDTSCVKRYPERRRTPYEHAEEIQERFKYRDFTDPTWGRAFRGFLYGRAWTHAEGPVALFNHAVTWLRKNRHRICGPEASIRSSPRLAGYSASRRRRGNGARPATRDLPYGWCLS